MFRLKDSLTQLLLFAVFARVDADAILSTNTGSLLRVKYDYFDYDGSLLYIDENNAEKI